MVLPHPNLGSPQPFPGAPCLAAPPETCPHVEEGVSGVSL